MLHIKGYSRDRAGLDHTGVISDKITSVFELAVHKCERVHILWGEGTSGSHVRIDDDE